MGSVVFLKRTYEIRVCIYQAAYENTLVRFIQGVLLVTTSASGFAEREIILHFISKGRKEE